MNKCILRGNVGQDPTITNFDNGGKVAQFTLATTERGYKTKDGREIPDVTDWHNIVVRQTGLAGVVEQHVKKGTPLLVCGGRHFITEIILDELELLGGQKREQSPAPAPEYTPGNYTPAVEDMPV